MTETAERIAARAASIDSLMANFAGELPAARAKLVKAINGEGSAETIANLAYHDLTDAEIHGTFAAAYAGWTKYITRNIEDPESKTREAFAAAVAEHGLATVALALTTYETWRKSEPARTSTNPASNLIRDAYDRTTREMFSHYGLYLGITLDRLIIIGSPLSAAIYASL